MKVLSRKKHIFRLAKTFLLFFREIKKSHFLTYEIATILCMNVCPMKTNSSSASMSHFSLIAIIWQETIGQDKPTFLVAWKVILRIYFFNHFSVKSTFMKCLFFSWNQLSTYITVGQKIEKGLIKQLFY